MRTVLLLSFFISFYVFSSVHSIEERELSFKKSKTLGFLKVIPSEGYRLDTDSLKLMLFTFPII